MTVVSIDSKDKEVFVNLSKEEIRIIFYALTYINNYVVENEEHEKNNTLTIEFEKLSDRL